MARYTIDFSTNAASVIREIAKVNNAITEVARTGKSVELDLDATKLKQSIDATFKQLDKQIAKYERQLRKLKIGSPEFIGLAGQIGAREGVRERGTLQAQSARLREQAFAFEPGSAIALGKALQAARIEASQIKPATEEWMVLQRRIASINFDLQQADKLAENIQMQQTLGAFAPGSLNALEAKLTILRNKARQISPDTVEWKELNKEIAQLEQGIERQTRRPLSTGQRLGAAGGAFLYGGGLGGGIGSALGGIGGGLIGGVPGAFTGAAVGQAVDNLTAMAFAMNEQANAIKRLRLGLASVSKDLQDFGQANEEITGISNRLLIPLEETYRQFTQLRASTVALGIDTKTTSEIFEGVATAVLKTGGSMADVQGAMRAVSQVFSKGKVTAEELRGQLGERLPGAVVKFAQANNLAIQDLDKAFETGQVSVDQFVTFAKGLLEESSGYSDELATRQEYASARYAKAIERMQLAVGKAVGPMLNSIQSFAADAVNEILWLTGKLDDFAKFLEGRFGGGEAGNVFLGEGAKNIADRIIGGETEIKDLDDRTRFFESKINQARNQLESIQSGRYEDRRNIFERMFGGPGEENLRKNLPTQIAFYKKQLNELLQARKIAEGKMKGSGSAIPGSEGNDENAKKAEKLLSLVEKREEDIASARQKYEEEISSVRENAIRQAENLERNYNDKRLQAEQEIARTRRELAASQAEQELTRRELASGVSGEDPALIEQERQIGQIIRQFTEEKISIEEQAQRDQLALSRELEDFKRQNADAINKANERYARAIGEIQQKYASATAKAIGEGSNSAAKKLAAAGKLVAADIQRATQQQAFTAATGGAIIPRGQKFEVAGGLYNEQELFQAADALSKAAGTAARAYVQATKDIAKAQKELTSTLNTPSRTAASVSVSSVSVGDIYGKVEAASQGLGSAIESSAQVKGALNTEKLIENALNLLEQQTEEGRKRIQDLDKENRLILDQIDLIQNGTLPALAEADAVQARRADTERTLLKNAADSYAAQLKGIKGLDEEGRQEILKRITGELQKQLVVIDQQEELYQKLSQTQRDQLGMLEAASIEAQTKFTGAGLRAGFLGRAGSIYEEKLGKGVSPEVARSVAEATQKLEMAELAANSLGEAFTGMGDSFSEAFTSVVQGTGGVKDALAKMFNDIANSFINMAVRMIAQYLIMKAIGLIASFFGGGGDTSGINAETLGGIAQYNQPVTTTMGDFGGIANANGNVLVGGFQAFANGGVVTGPTLGLVGEGRFNEAVVPLPDGRKIPVDLQGSTGQDINTNIVVNINNGGGGATSNVTGNRGNAFAKEIEGAVRQVILKETRPGGLIYNA